MVSLAEKVRIWIVDEEDKEDISFDQRARTGPWNIMVAVHKCTSKQCPISGNKAMLLHLSHYTPLPHREFTTPAG